jgi:hypothetical protein
MRTGRLSISRGHQMEGAPVGVSAPPPHLTLVQLPAEQAPAPVFAPETAPPVTADYQLLHDRLTALERLARLFELGTLSAEEFAAEKALVLAQPAGELLLREPAPVHFVPAAPRKAAPARGPSLLGRMLGWKLLLVGLVAGIGLSFAAQPAETQRFFEQALRLIGA